MSFPAVVCCLILRAIIVRHHRCPPPSSSTNVVVLVVRCHHLQLPQPSLPLRCLCHLLRPTLVLPHLSLLPNLTCHHRLPLSRSAFAIVVCRRGLLLLQPSLPLCCLRHLLLLTLVLPHHSPMPDLARHCHPLPLSSPAVVLPRCHCHLLPPSSAAASIIANPPSPPSLTNVSCCHFFSQSDIVENSCQPLPTATTISFLHHTVLPPLVHRRCTSCHS